MADGREHLRQNLVFLLRAAPLASPYYWSEWNALFPQHHEEAGYIASAASVHEGVIQNYGVRVENRQPVQWNHWFRNYLLETNETGPFHSFNWDGDFSKSVPAPALLSRGEPYWISQDYLLPSVSVALFSLWPEWLAKLGVILSTNEGSAWTVTYSMTMATSVAQNWWGLSVLPGLGVDTTGWAIDPETGFPHPVPAQYQTLSPGATISWSPRPPARYYSRFAEPEFAPLGYYFAPVGERWTADGRLEPLAPLPTFPNFAPTNPTPTLLAAGGKKLTVGGWAKLGITNGYADKLAYLGQYFDRAYKVGSNGLPTLDESGVLSPYGEFFPVEAGRFDLTTLPDGISTSSGWCRVHVVKLALDVNHDGEMNLTWNGPDNTSASRPMQFWVNNDYDRHHRFLEPDLANVYDEEEDDLEIPMVAGLPVGMNYPDSDVISSLGGARLIPSKRDLEDYTRLWAAGLRAAYQANTNLIFQLSIRGASAADQPAINVVRALEPDGATRYLSDALAAQLQTNTAYLGYMRRVSPGQPVQLNDLFDSITGPSDYFLFCGAAKGKGEIVLSVLLGTNVLVETSQWIDLREVSEFCKRWSCGDGSLEPVRELKRHPLYAEFAPPENNQERDYILYVHGYNMKEETKRRWVETTYKRLWQLGYQGRVAGFTWPCTRVGVEYDPSEERAWQSGIRLHELLSNLKTAGYRVHVLGHSQGNVVISEALRLAGTNANLVRTYVASQAALPADCYDTSAPLRALFIGSTPNVYARYWMSGNSANYPAQWPNTNPAYPGSNYMQGAAAKFVNFYNPQDWALTALSSPTWEYDQALKPSALWGYGYNGSEGFHKIERVHPLPEVRFPLAFPTNRFAIFAHGAESWSKALGATSVGGVFVSDTGSRNEVNLQATLGFGNTHRFHSGQFRSSMSERVGFWNRLMIESGLKDPE
jgi:hypothetical protein